MSSSDHGKPAARRELAPLDPPTLPFAVGGMALWAGAGLVLLAFRRTLAEHGRTSWLWICLAGFMIGFPGLFVMIRHDRNRRLRRARPTVDAPGDGESAPHRTQ